MSKVQYTKEQLQSINLRNKNIIVSAQAGAGKTQVLVQRIIALLDEEKIDINEFLIVTFTNKAAAEMKDRIKKGLHAKLEDADSSERYFYQKQYNNTSNAQISTMHAFCINVLRDYFYKLGINPAFKILTGSSLDILKWQTINDVFEELYKDENKEFFNLLDRYSKKYNDEYLKTILFNLYDFIQSQINPFEWLKNSINKYHYKNYYNIEEYYNDRKIELFEFYKSKFNNIYDTAKNNIEKIYEVQKKIGSDIYLKTITSDIKLIENLYNVNNFDDFNLHFSNISFNRLESVSKKKIESEELDEDVVDLVKSLINQYRDEVKDFSKNLILDIDKDIDFEDDMKNILESMYYVLEKFDKKYTENKLKKNSLDFSDVEHLAIKLLDDNEVVEEFKNRFKYIFFDEYQDSNHVQNYIVNKISRGNNLFFVGDIKQSIYKFRLADPIIFKSRYEDYKKQLDINQAIDLRHNFRSERVLLHFNNFIFNNLMTNKLGDVEYDHEAHRLTPGLNSENYDDEKSKVELIFINKDQDNIDSLDVKKEYKNINPEAVFVAKKIKELVGDGQSYKDMAILSRNSTIIPEIEENLKLLDIPYYSDSSKFSFEDIELKVFIEILKAIENDTEDLVLLSAITSTISNMTDQDIAEIRGEDKDHSFNYCFRNYSNRTDLKEEILSKINLYNKKIEEYRKLEKTMSLENLAWYVLVDSGHMSYVLSKVNGEKLLDNIYLFIEEISEFENTSFQTLSSLINYIDRMSEKKLGEREAGADLSEEDDVVRIMTIHKSKGLQFKNVFLVSLNTKFNTRDLNSEIILNDKYGIALQNKDLVENKPVKNFYFERISELKKRELMSEEVRILYVALTRAEKSLYLISSDKNESLKYDSNLEKLDSFHKWIYSILSKDKISDKFIFGDGKLDYFSDKQSNLSFYSPLSSELILDYSKLMNNDSVDLEIYVDSNNKFLKQIFNFKYDDSKISIPYKKTVTEISSKDKNISPDFKEYEKIFEDRNMFEKNSLDNKPKFLQENVYDLDAMELGGLYHYILEILPLGYTNREEIIKFIDTLLNNKFISKYEFDAINIDVILRYIESDLYKRLSNADNINRERSFTMKYEEDGNIFLVDGQIDLYFEENGELVILDFKTNKTIDEYIYKKQLELYKIGLEKATGMKVKDKIIYWVMHGVVSSI